MFIKQIQYIFVVIYGPPCTVDSSCIPQPLEMKKEERKDEYEYLNGYVYINFFVT